MTWRQLPSGRNDHDHRIGTESCGAAGVLVLGVYPKPLTDLMEPSIANLATQIATSKL